MQNDVTKSTSSSVHTLDDVENAGEATGDADALGGADTVLGVHVGTAGEGTRGVPGPSSSAVAEAGCAHVHAFGGSPRLFTGGGGDRR